MADTVEKNKEVEKDSKVLVAKSTKESGQPRIVSSSKFIEDSAEKELKMPHRICTFDQMCNDDAVFNAVDVTMLLSVLSLYKGKFKEKKTEKSKKAASFLNYCIRNMTFGSWMDACQNACTDTKYGFSLLNIVTERAKSGKYAGDFVLRKLSPRSQHSITGWVWNENNTELLGVLQKPLLKGERLTFRGNLKYSARLLKPENEETYIKSSQLLHFKYNSTNNNPQGDSPLMHCYKAYKEKQLIERYEVIGVSKDMGGALVLKVPSELLELVEAGNKDAIEAYDELQQDAANLHAGESSYIVLQSDVDPVSKKPIYDVEFRGIDGGGKQYTTSAIIDQKRKSIYNVFGAGFLLLGQDTVGSYNLADSATNTHAFYVERNVLQKKEVIDSLGKRLLKVNGIELDWEDFPEFEPADPQKQSLEVVSKVVQRMKSVGGLTLEALTHIYEEAGLPTDGLDKLDMFAKGSSRAGESQGSSGTGNTQEGGIASTTNNENSEVTKHYTLDREEDGVIYAISDDGETVCIEKE